MSNWLHKEWNKVANNGPFIPIVDVATPCWSKSDKEPAKRAEKSLETVTKSSATTEKVSTTLKPTEIPTTNQANQEVTTTSAKTLDERIQAIKDEFLDDDDDVGEEIASSTAETVTYRNEASSTSSPTSYISFDWNLIQVD